jgi:hypothetical protein
MSSDWSLFESRMLTKRTRAHPTQRKPIKMTSRCHNCLCLLIVANLWVHSVSISSFAESSLGRSNVNLVDEKTCLDEGSCTDSCTDINDMCDLWASRGDCEQNPKYMLKYCQKSCRLCGVSNSTSAE